MAVKIVKEFIKAFVTMPTYSNIFDPEAIIIGRRHQQSQTFSPGNRRNKENFATGILSECGIVNAEHANAASCWVLIKFVKATTRNQK